MCRLNPKAARRGDSCADKPGNARVNKTCKEPRDLRCAHGFTLIELMIAVAIVAILAGIAYPSYLNQMSTSRRVEGQAMLLEAGSKQERFFTENNIYAASMTALGYQTNNQATENGWYQVSVTAADATGYTLQAVPQGAQAPDARCGTLSLNAFGVKTESGTAASWQDCW
jgi:type IV pilus assembly protein PilE